MPDARVREILGRSGSGCASVENCNALGRIDALRASRARVRFLSVEPLLEDLGALDLRGIHWVIVGGQSGPHFRPVGTRLVTVG